MNRFPTFAEQRAAQAEYLKDNPDLAEYRRKIAELEKPIIEALSKMTQAEISAFWKRMRPRYTTLDCVARQGCHTAVARPMD